MAKPKSKTKSRSNQPRVVHTKHNRKSNLDKGKTKIVRGEIITPGSAGKKIIGQTAKQVKKIRKHGPGRREYEAMKKKLGIDTNKGAEINILGKWMKLGE